MSNLYGKEINLLQGKIMINSTEYPIMGNNAVDLTVPLTDIFMRLTGQQGVIQNIKYMEKTVSGENKQYLEFTWSAKNQNDENIITEVDISDLIDSDEVLAAIGNLDANINQTAGNDGLALSITQEDGKITNISGSIAADTYEPFGVKDRLVAFYKKDEKGKELKGHLVLDWSN